MSTYEDDDLLRGFLAEAGEHLANIEADLLTIEDAGANMDEELVNKVFRAAHSIKGGSSFLGLNRIKELAHKAETVLDMVRSRRITPNPEITNVLLAAFDKLRDMLNNCAESENADIWEHVASLNQLAASYLPEEQKDSLSRMTLLKSEKESSPIGISEVDLERARRTGQFVYAVEYDLSHDIERKGKNVLEVFAGLYESGEILDCVTDFEAVGSLDDPICSKVPLRLVFATILDPDLIGTLFEVDDDRIKLLIDPNVPEQRQVETVPLQTGQTPAIQSPSDQEAILETQVEAFEPQQVEAYTGPAQPTFASPRNGQEQIAAKNKAAASRGESTLRVDVELLESLMNLAESSF